MIRQGREKFASTLRLIKEKNQAILRDRGEEEERKLPCQDGLHGGISRLLIDSDRSKIGENEYCR
jgi:hypothetical protein